MFHQTRQINATLKYFWPLQNSQPALVYKTPDNPPQPSYFIRLHKQAFLLTAFFTHSFTPPAFVHIKPIHTHSPSSIPLPHSSFQPTHPHILLLQSRSQQSLTRAFQHLLLPTSTLNDKNPHRPTIQQLPPAPNLSTRSTASPYKPSSSKKHPFPLKDKNQHPQQSTRPPHRPLHPNLHLTHKTRPPQNPLTPSHAMLKAQHTQSVHNA